MSRRVTTEEFITMARIMHKDKYDYSLVDYIDSTAKVKIICPEHGIFEQTSSSHISQGHGCGKCSRTYNMSNEEYVAELKEVWGDRYCYNQVEFVNLNTHINVGCEIHGMFQISAKRHLNNGSGCRKCAQQKRDKVRSDYKIKNDLRIIEWKKKRQNFIVN